MILDPNDPRLGNTADLVFRSFWPSSDSMYGKVAAVLKSAAGEQSVMQSAMQSNWDALRIALRHKATAIGDFLTKDFAQASYFKATPGGQALQGLFASVEWSTVRNDPGQALEAMARVGVPAALTALTGVPLAGTVAAAYFAVGLKLAEIASSKSFDPLVLPWSEYSRDSDEDLTAKVVLGIYAKSVDQTNLFRPPWDPSAEWRMGIAGDPRNPRGVVWSPWHKDSIPWRSDGIGALPGTLRVFGQVQLSRGGPHDPALDRVVRFARGFSPKEQALRWPPTKTNVGDYYPSTASTCAMLGSLAGSPGSPDMYKIHVPILLDEWRRAFRSMEDSFIDLWNNPGRLIKDLAGVYISHVRQSLSHAQSPWVAVQIQPGDKWTIGIPWNAPSNWGIVTPAIYKGGLPGDPAGRTEALWIEEDSPKSPDVPGWPYGATPRQHRCARRNRCDTDLSAEIDPETLRREAPAAPKGYRRMPWPPPEVDAAKYSSPFEAIVKPALDRLRLQQVRSLRRTLVCAYVRPVETAGHPAYGAFRDKELRDLCLQVREVLLTHPLRFRLNLKDVEAIDPAFAVRLKQSGVTGGPGDFSKSLGISAGAPLIAGAEQPPDNEAPQGGIPFVDDARAYLTRRPNLRRALAIGGGLAAAGIVAGYFINRREHGR